MSGITALTKIRTRTKQLQKKHPNAKFRTLQKQAAREYNAGTIPKKRAKKAKRKVSGKRKYKVTHRVKKVGAVKRHRAKRTTPRKTKRVRTVTRTKTVYRRVGAAKSNMPLIIGGLALAGIAAYLLLKKPALPIPLAVSTNPATAAAQNNILQYAQALGLGVTALTALINALNSSSDAAVQAASAQVSAGGGIPPDLSGGGGGQPWLA